MIYNKAIFSDVFGELSLRQAPVDNLVCNNSNYFSGMHKRDKIIRYSLNKNNQ